MSPLKKALIHMVTALAEMNLIHFGLHFFGNVKLFGLTLYGGSVVLAMAVVMLAIHCLVEKLIHHLSHRKA